MYLHIVISEAPNRAHNHGIGPLKTQHLISHINYNNQYIIMPPPLAKGPCYSIPLLTPVRHPCI